MPTVYKLPKKSIPAKDPTPEAVRIWKKHREAKDKDPKKPALKN
jgi:hypothetical protein